MSGAAQSPRHFTATVLQRLPPRTRDVGDGLEAWFDAMAALSLLPIMGGIWALSHPTFPRQMTDTIRLAVSGLSGVLVNHGTTLTTYIAVAVIAVVVINSLGLVEET